MPKIRHVVLTGLPGVGKTTLTQKLCEKLISHGASLTGFYTEEVRMQGRRIGFDVVSVPGGQRKALARVLGKGERSKGPMVGQYAVDIASFESVALPALATQQKDCIIIIDEVGKMELFSTRFVSALESAFRSHAVLATIPSAKGRPIPTVERIRTRQDVRLFTVERTNRDDPTMLVEILAILTAS